MLRFFFFSTRVLMRCWPFANTFSTNVSLPEMFFSVFGAHSGFLYIYIWWVRLFLPFALRLRALQQRILQPSWGGWECSRRWLWLWLGRKTLDARSSFLERHILGSRCGKEFISSAPIAFLNSLKELKLPSPFYRFLIHKRQLVTSCQVDFMFICFKPLLSGRFPGGQRGQLSTRITAMGASSRHFLSWRRRLLCPNDEPALVRSVCVSLRKQRKDAGESVSASTLIWVVYRHGLKGHFPWKILTPKET